MTSYDGTFYKVDKVKTLQITDTTQAISTLTGCLIASGGISIGKDTYIGGKIVATSTLEGSNLSGSNSGDVTLTSIGSTANANGASLSGQQLQLQPASTVYGGIVSTGTQSFAGIKTFANTTASSSTDTGAVVVRGGIGCAGEIYTGKGINITQSQTSITRITDPGSAVYMNSMELLAPNLTTGQENIIQFGKDLSAYNCGMIGFNYTGAGSASNFLTLSHNGVADMVKLYANGQFNITTTTEATSISTGALVVSGGIGCGRIIPTNVRTGGHWGNGSLGTIDLYQGSDGGSYGWYFATIGLNASRVNNAWTYNTDGGTTGGSFLVSDILGNLRFYTYGVSGLSPALTDAQNASNIRMNIDKNGIVGIHSTTGSASTSTGALVVNGGVGIGENIRLGGHIVLNNSFGIFWKNTTGNDTGVMSLDSSNNFAISNNAGGTCTFGNLATNTYIQGLSSIVNNTTNSISTSTGALVVAGGIACANQFTIGNAIQSNVTLTDGTSIAMHLGHSATDYQRFNIGLNTTESGGNVGSNFKIWRYADDNKYLDDALTIYRSNGDVLIGSVTNSSSTSTGALQIAGGIGCYKDIRCNNIYANNIGSTASGTFNLTIRCANFADTTLDCTYYKVGKNITMHVLSVNAIGTGNAGYAYTTTAIASAHRPTASWYVENKLIMVKTGDVYYLGRALIASDGVLYIYLSHDGNFTSTNAQYSGWDSFTMSWVCNDAA